MDELERWWNSALCAQVDRELWFMRTGDNGETAKKICSRCEVRLQCLVDDLTQEQQGQGIFAGFGVDARRKMHRRVELGWDPEEVALRAIERQTAMRRRASAA